MTRKQLEKYLDKLNIRIDHAILSDKPTKKLEVEHKRILKALGAV